MKATQALDFAQFLLDRALIDAVAADRIRHRSRTEKKPLGQLLVINGDMTVAQVMRVLDSQVDTPHKRFGELAVEAGHITTVTLETALRQQQSEQKHQIEVARQEGEISPRTLEEIIPAYVRLLELHFRQEVAAAS